MYIKQSEVGRGDLRSPSGSKVQPKYGMKFDVNLKREVPAQVGTQPWYDMIQSYREGTELKSVIAMIKNGTIPQSQIENYIGQLKEQSFIDVSGMPSSFVEISALNTRMKSTYNELPADLKSLFGNDIQRMAAAVIDGSFNNILTNYYQSKRPQVRKEVTENANK